MENVALIETGVLSGMIMTIVQLIIWFVPNINKRLTTLIVSLVLSIVAIISVETLGYVEAILAVLGQVFAYDFILQPTKNAINGK